MTSFLNENFRWLVSVFLTIFLMVGGFVVSSINDQVQEATRINNEQSLQLMESRTEIRFIGEELVKINRKLDHLMEKK